MRLRIACHQNSGAGPGTGQFKKNKDMTASKKCYEYRGHRVTISYTTYRKTGTLAVLMNYIDGEMESDYDVVSVNLCSGLQDGQMAYVDTNNIPEIDRWLVENGIAEDTGVRTVSGFCTYPLLQFNQVQEEATL